MRRQRQSSRKLFAQNTKRSPLRTAGRVAISTRLGRRSASVSRPHERKNTAAQVPISIILDSNQRAIQGQGRNHTQINGGHRLRVPNFDRPPPSWRSRLGMSVFLLTIRADIAAVPHLNKRTLTGSMQMWFISKLVEESRCTVFALLSLSCPRACRFRRRTPQWKRGPILTIASEKSSSRARFRLRPHQLSRKLKNLQGMSRPR